jgi:PelA/Pel-15E family pectate lyase
MIKLANRERTSLKLVNLLFTIFLLISFTAFSQSKNFKDNSDSIDVKPFADAANHWYGINDKGTIVHAAPTQARFKTSDLEKVGDNILLYQKNNGGWPKNYDMMAILTPEQKDSLIQAKNILNTTFDNGTTYTHVATLAKIYTVTQAEKFKNAALKGIDFILAAQYSNGGWPQYYPLEDNYSKYITYNDGAFEGIMEVLKDAIEGKPQYSFLDKERLKMLKIAYNKGLDCLIKTQINDNGKLTAWCQQYNEVTLEPAWARKFEPPSICNGESSDIVLFLMSIENPDERIIRSIQNAVAWFQESEIMNTRVKVIEAPTMQTPYRVSNTDRIVVNEPNTSPIWTRYYELKTHRPLFCNRDSKVVYSLAEVDRERRDGYSWYTYAPQKVLNLYPAWQKKWSK